MAKRQAVKAKSATTKKKAAATTTKKKVTAAATKAPLKKAASTKTSPARTPAGKKKPIGFEMMKSYQTSIEKSFEKMQNLFDGCGESLNDYVYEGKKKNATVTRSLLMDISKEVKNLRNIIQESKMKLKPVYKS